jgi:hypothetical protein
LTRGGSEQLIRHIKGRGRRCKLKFKEALVISFLALLLVASCSRSSLYISGDEEAIGAEIYVDGEEVGYLEKRVYSGTTSKNSTVVKREKRLQELLEIRSGDEFAGAEIKVPAGKYKIMFISKAGKRVQKEIRIQGEQYIAVDFEKMVIRGGE